LLNILTTRFFTLTLFKVDELPKLGSKKADLKGVKKLALKLSKTI